MPVKGFRWNKGEDEIRIRFSGQNVAPKPSPKTESANWVNNQGYKAEVLLIRGWISRSPLGFGFDFGFR